MEPIPCRILPYGTGGAAENMALDHALLDAVDADPSSAFLRTYGWSTPSLSLGYFQSMDEARSDPRWADVPIVRRPSGGGALWHDRELTYALIVPRTLPLATRPSALYRAVHEAIAASLRGAKVPATRRGEVGPRVGPKPFLCFLDRDPEDVMLAGRKIVGSAQRRRTSAVLQHGSLLLGRSPATPELPGLEDLAESSTPAADWSRRLELALTGALGLSASVRELSEHIRSRTKALALDVYASPAWTDRR